MGKYQNLLKKHKSVRKAAKAEGIARSTFFDRLNQETATKTVSKSLAKTKTVKASKGAVQRYIFTSAVAGAEVHADFLKNLQAYAEHVGAKLIVGALTNATRQRYAGYTEEDYAPELRPYIHNDPLVLGDKARYCPELNLVPSMVQPLSGLNTYTKRLWAIFPHTKLSVDTVPTHKGRPAKFLTTTGAVTLPHYTPTKAGHKARFDHILAAVVVEVTADGIWFRHVTPTDNEDGTFYDLDKIVCKGKVKTHTGIKAIVYGDMHVEKLDTEVGVATWAYPFKEYKQSLAELLRPEIQVFHDLMDFTAINHHELDNLFARYKNWIEYRSNVSGAFQVCADFMKHAQKFSKERIVVDSNHDHFVTKWLLKFDPVKAEDFENIEDYYRLKMEVLARIRAGEPYSVLGMALETMTTERERPVIDSYRFLLTDESYEVLGTELSWHGHAGPNGRRGSKHAFKMVSERSTVAHFHGAFIESGTHGVGTSSEMYLGYNQGASNWSPTHDILYPHGGRTLITMSAGKFWAGQ